MTRVRRLPASKAEPRYLRPDGNRRLRRRRRARAAARALVWIFVWTAGAGALAGAVAGGWSFLTGPDRFPLTAVIVEGGPDPVKAEVTAALAPWLGRNLLSLDLHDLEGRVAEHPWVNSVSLHRRLPNALLVILQPSGVEALVEIGGELRLVGEGGRDLGRYEPLWGAEDHPVITGVVAPTRSGSAERLEAGLTALRELRRASPGFVEGISTLDVSRVDRLTVSMRDFSPPLYLSPDAPHRNVDRLGAVRARLDEEGLGAVYLDLRFKDRIAVLPADEEFTEGRNGAS